MKKLLLALTLLLCLTTARAEGFGIGLGPKFGYQTAKLSLNSADIKDGFANHWTAGLFVRMHFGGFIINPELMYFKSDKVLNFDEENLKVTLNQQNLALPIYLGYMFDGSLFKLRLCAGPEMYFLVGQNQSSSDESVSFENIETQKLTWGAALNVGIDIWRITLDLSYSFGLSNIFKTDSLEVLGQTVNLDSKQNMFMVTLGFRFFD